MSNTQDICTELGDEALDAPVQHAFVCGGPLCYVSDEALDPAPAQEAAVCVSLFATSATKNSPRVSSSQNQF